MKVIIGSDHAGLEAKNKIIEFLEKHSIDYEDVGVYSKNSIDYPTIARKVCALVLETNNKGILICGSGTGMQIAANRIPGIRAAFIYDTYSSQMARKDNDANIATLRAREFDHEKYEELILNFLQTSFSKEPRHQRRIDQLG